MRKRSKRQGCGGFMATLVWNQDFTVGVRSMDDQHGILLDALNELRMALLQGAEGREIREMLARTCDLMRMHLESEDRLLALHRFPGIAAHREEKQRLMARLEQFNVRYEQRQRPAVYELVEFLRKWFTTHTANDKRSYGSYLHSR